MADQTRTGDLRQQVVSIYNSLLNAVDEWRVLVDLVLAESQVYPVVAKLVRVAYQDCQVFPNLRRLLPVPK